MLHSGQTWLGTAAAVTMTGELGASSWAPPLAMLSVTGSNIRQPYAQSDHFNGSLAVPILYSALPVEWMQYSHDSPALTTHLKRTK